jgi:hypothetical protein
VGLLTQGQIATGEELAWLTVLGYVTGLVSPEANPRVPSGPAPRVFEAVSEAAAHVELAGGLRDRPGNCLP